MKTVLYKTRRNRLLAGVLAGLADKFKFDLSLIRFFIHPFYHFVFWIWSCYLHFFSCTSSNQGRHRGRNVRDWTKKA